MSKQPLEINIDKIYFVDIVYTTDYVSMLQKAIGPILEKRLFETVPEGDVTLKVLVDSETGEAQIIGIDSDYHKE